LFKLAEQHGLGAYARALTESADRQLGGCTYQGCPAKVNGAYFWKADEQTLAQLRHTIAAAISSGQ
jgi:hypothetical protein